MFHVSVALLSGQRAIWASVGDLRVLAQKSFHHGVLKLLGGDHAVVDPAASLQAAGLKDGDHLTLIAIECHRGKAGSSTTGLLWRWPGCYMGLYGAPEIMAVIANQLWAHLLRSFRMDRLWLGAIHVAVTPLAVWSPRLAERCPADSSNLRNVFCDPGGRIGSDLGRSRRWWWQLSNCRSVFN